MDFDRYTDGSQRCNESRGRCGADREGCETVASGVPGAKGIGWGGRKPAWIYFRG